MASRRRPGAGAIPLRPRQKSSWGLSPSARMNELLKRRDVTHLVRSMPLPDLYTFIKQLGPGDAGPLLGLASGEQIQRLTDLEVWRRDEVDDPRLVEWLEAVIAANPEALAERLHALDPELVQAFLQRHIKVHVRVADDEGADPADFLRPEDMIATPDDVFILEAPGDDEAVDFIRRMLDLLYRQDAELARGLLFQAITGLPSTFEEEAYRIRQGRMEELGFVDFYEALSLYQPLAQGAAPPARERGRGGSELQTVPVVPAPSAGASGTFLARALAALPPEHPADELRRDLAHLANKVMAAEQWDPGDEDAGRAAIGAVYDGVGVGLELMSGGDLSAATELLWTVHPEHLFRVCQTRLVELGRGARRSWEAAISRLALPEGISLCPDPPGDALLTSLQRRRPLLPAVVLGDGSGERPFRSRQELVAAEALVAEIVASGELVGRYLSFGELDADALKAALGDAGIVTPGALLLTALARRISGGAFSPAPVTASQARRFLRVARQPGATPESPAALREELIAELNKLASAFGDGAPLGLAEGALRWISRLNDQFSEVYGALDLDEALDPRFVEGPLLIAPDEP